MVNYIHTHVNGAILSKPYLAGRMENLGPLIHSYPCNSTLGLGWEEEEEEEEEDEEEQEEWEERERAVKAVFIFTPDGIMKPPELFLQMM